jgi:hypothetical protein
MNVRTFLAHAARRSIVACALLPMLHGSTAAQSNAVPEIGPRIWAKPDNFWFRRAVPGGHVWINVDALHGAKEPLFDHQRLAIEMTIRTGTQYEPLTLPFADPALQFTVKYDGSNAYIQEGAMAVEFLLGGFLWRCDLQIKWDWNRVPPTDYECLSRRRADNVAGHDASPERHTSPDGRWEAFVQHNNVHVRSIDAGTHAAVRYSTDGSADFAYDAGSIRWSDDSQSLHAWRLHEKIWMDDGVTANVKALVARGEWKVPGAR